MRFLANQLPVHPRLSLVALPSPAGTSPCQRPPATLRKTPHCRPYGAAGAFLRRRRAAIEPQRTGIPPRPPTHARLRRAEGGVQLAEVGIDLVRLAGAKRRYAAEPD